MSDTYVHGYDARETERLDDQALALVQLLHADTAYPPGSEVLEVGCGTGAQTITLARRSPDARFTSIDVSEASLAAARRRAVEAGLTNVAFQRADLYKLGHPVPERQPDWLHGSEQPAHRESFTLDDRG